MENLTLTENSLIESESIDSIVKILCKNSTQQPCGAQLKLLSLEKTSITREGFLKLFSFLNESSLENLSFGTTSLHYFPTLKEGFNNSVYEWLGNANFSSLRELQMNEADLDFEQVQYLAKMKLTNLEKLSLTDNFLDD